ncbi:DNA-3-methyladenine glycosylase I [Stagnihabitans tardus]|uniref:3-methyladenine DNA glycosylase n=1 Tax=Stagnihabitans tardus TaxID=2699202 RepID=A0AAE4YB43_9RHOB|nr:DNA-3-methyladenine glycosylase I [Stagnihabitans tardus]NBZ89427.1 3-methyladenine DNA glycosylase [Stagnihabitans tardus]
MRSFAEILEIAASRHGGAEAVLADVPVPKSPEALAAIPDDLWLAQMAKGIFQAGISWKVVDNKWEGIRSAFHDFRPARVALIAGDELDDLLDDTRVIRSGPKIVAIRDNAVWMTKVAAEHGSFAARIAHWPGEDYGGLLAWLAKEGARLGGNTGAYALRAMGRDGFTLSADVVARLVEEGVIDAAPSSSRALKAVQEAFNQWRTESGLPLTTISRILARSIDA